jgi:FkbM family methyltransferase
MQRGAYKHVIQGLARRMGYQIRRVDGDVDFVDAYGEQVRLLRGKPVETIFEVGAADGTHCVKYADQFPTARVVAFEPLPASFRKLQANAATRPGRVVAVNCALSDSIGVARFHQAEWDDASSLLTPKQTGSTHDQYNASKGTIEVRTDTMDAYCAANGVTRIDLLKMDAQGAEMKILAGAEETLAKRGIQVIYTEINFLENWSGAARFDRLMTHLTDRGYRLHNLYNLVANQKGQLAWGDAIFVANTLSY